MSQHQLAVSHVEHVMGMAVSFDIRPPVPPDDALRSVIEWLHHVDATFSTYKDDSEITRFARGEITVDELTTDVIDVLQRCMDLTAITDGAFDAFVVPAPNGTLLDPSGYVKGWAIERAASMLQSSGASNFCINAGGDVAVRGSASNDEPWRVGIRHPSMPHHQAAVIEVFGPCSIATSATYERGAHIINPRDGQPTTCIASATVIGPDLGTADAFATAVFVMGEDGFGWIESQPDYEAYIITNDEIAMWTSAFPHS